MPISDRGPAGRDGPEDDPWDVVLDEEFVRAATIKEPAYPRPARPAEDGGRSRWGAVLVGAVFALAVLLVLALVLVDRYADAVPSPVPTAVTASAAPGVTAPAAASAPADPARSALRMPRQSPVK
ncbi:hypothetical protein [Kitasatospora camelliae]|uniref:Uncharacterized protein n=1 Tax=Kitasatospora camelliae TaxID=3156397 RepID=A0AAU8K316_9ACTN